MLNFILQKLTRVLIILLSVEVLVFLLVHAVPGGPWDTPANQVRALGNVFVDDKSLAQRYAYYGLDLPLWRQFTRYLIGDYHADGEYVCGVICGNFGPSTRQVGRSVQDILFHPPEGQSAWNSKFGYTIRLVTFAFATVVILGIP